MPPTIHNIHILPVLLPARPQLQLDPITFLGPLARNPHLKIRVVLPGALALPRATDPCAITITLAAQVFLVGGVGGLLFLWQGRGCLAAQDGQAARGVGILHALLGGVLLGCGGGLVALDAGYVVGIIDVPGLLAEEMAVGAGWLVIVSWALVQFGGKAYRGMAAGVA